MHSVHRVSPHLLKALLRDIILVNGSYSCKCGEESGATAFCSESNREGTNILEVKGTTHTGMKDIRTKATVITLASLGVGQLKKMSNLTVQLFSGSKSVDRL